ncbi:MAG: hypothetical protein HUU55_19180 [Myxococcales bacterium]|nr:hypothetical protein [Myxococcales bacterium]
MICVRNLRNALWTTAVFAVAAAGCSDSDISQQTTLEGGPVVIFQTPAPLQKYETSGAPVDVSATVLVLGLNADGATVQMLLDDNVVGTLSAEGSFTYEGVPLGLHRMVAQAVHADGSNVEGDNTRDTVDVVIISACQDNAACDDGSDCTVDVCGSDGKCQYFVSADCAGGGAPIGPKCKESSECASLVSGQGTCMIAFCDEASKTCVVGDLDGLACEDGNLCTTGETCTGAVCGGGLELQCNDNDPCTDDVCNPGKGCEFSANTTCDCETDADCDSLDDGDKCNGWKRCIDNQCQDDPSTIPQCSSDVVACVTTECVPETGECIPVAVDDGAACNDDNPCTTDDACVGGFCSGTYSACNDNDPCTSDECDPLSGCAYEPTDGACDDGNPCTINDVCSDGSCGGQPLVCDDNNPCTADSCTAGACVYSAVNGTCGGGDACSSDGVCVGGICVVIQPDCNDSNPCTDDSCDSAAGCINVPNQAACADGNPCISAGVCTGGACVPGTPKDCGDNDVCTDDLCNALTGECVHFAGNGATCDDGNTCTINDICVAGVCQGEGGDQCDDGNPCTTDVCGANGSCSHQPATGGACEDGNPCTSGDTCAAGTCKAGTPTVCNDNNVCTTDTCSPASGCVHTPTSGGACDDNNGCTVTDVCTNGVCVGSGGPDCNDNNPCTVDTCTLADGCVNTPTTGACDDGNACTVGQTCTGGVCGGGTVLNCNDNNACTTDSCNPASGCVNTATNGGACSDGNACTVGDVCENGTCKAGTAKDCNDNNACTTDGCNTATGVCSSVPVANNTACNDGNACTSADKCTAGTCSGTALVCNDSNACTTDSCAPATGCVFTNNTSACNDNNACTVGDVCASGGCVAGAAVVCNDNNPCTTDSCDPTKGCVFVNNTNACDDGNQCTTGDKCAVGKCTGITPVTCNDNNVCTTDTCLPASGCNFTNNTAGCDDGDPCTLSDTCGSGVCVPGSKDPACEPPSGCAISGAQGSTVVCPLLVARQSNAIPLPAALQFKLTYDAVALKIVQFQDQVCFGPGGGPPCILAMVPPAPLSPSGHTMSLAPDPVSAWNGSGVIILANVSDPTSPVSSAYLDAGGEVVGDAKFLEIVFELKTAIPAAAPKYFTASDIIAASAAAEPLEGKYINGVMVISTEFLDCNAAPEICDDSIACTVDTCNKGTGFCSNTPNNAACDDGFACTADKCSTVSGCQYTEDDSKCTDGKACTADLCDADAGCVFPPIMNGQSCNDGNPCTTGEICQAGTCGGGVVQNCDDEDPCTADSCVPGTGCVHAPQNGVACDDGNGCTVNDSCSNGVCQPGLPLQTPECTGETTTAVCELYGAVGATVTCAFNLAAAAEAGPFTTGIQYTLTFDASKLELVNFYDEACFAGIGCFPVALTGAGSFPLSTGHSLSIGPPKIADWNRKPCSAVAPCGTGIACVGGFCAGSGGFGGVVIVNLSNPTANITPAYLNAAGAVQLDPLYMTAQFKVLQAIPQATPETVDAGSALGTDKTSVTLDIVIKNFVMISSKK